MGEFDPGTVPIPDEITRKQQAAPTGTEHLRRQRARVGEQPSSPDAPTSAESTSADQPAILEESGTPTAYAQDELDLGIPKLGEQPTSDPEPSTPKTYIQDELDLGIPKLEAQPNNPNRLFGRLARGLDRISGLLHRTENIRTPRQFIGDKIESAKQRHEEASKTAWYVGSAGTMSASVRREKPVAPAAGESVTTMREQLSALGTQARERSSERLTKGLNTAKKMGRVAALGTGLTIALPFVAAAVGTEYVNRKTREVAGNVTTGVKNTYHQARVDASEEKKRGATTRANDTEQKWNERETALKNKHEAAQKELNKDASDKSQSAVKRRSTVEAEAIAKAQQSRIALLKARHALELAELDAKRTRKVEPQRLRAKDHDERATAHRGKIVKKATKASTAAAA